VDSTGFKSKGRTASLIKPYEFATDRRLTTWSITNQPTNWPIN